MNRITVAVAAVAGLALTARDALFLGAGSSENSEDTGIHLFLDPSASGTRRRPARRVSHVGSAVCAEHLVDVQPALHSTGSSHRRHDLFVLGQLCRDRRSERPGVAGMACRERCHRGDDGSRRSLSTNTDRGQPVTDRVLPALPVGTLSRRPRRQLVTWRRRKSAAAGTWYRRRQAA